MTRYISVFLAALLFAASFAADTIRENHFVTLGTAGGPLSEATRSQPANALVAGDDLYLVDAGDGAVQQLTAAGYRLTDVDAVFLSHLHFDHTGGLLAVLGLRMQLTARSTLDIYGPPGTKHLVDGLLHAMSPTMKSAYGMPGQEWTANVRITELGDGDILELEGMEVTAAANSHFRIPGDDGAREKAVSLSYRFDLAERSIVYTGDTGPSAAVEELARNADLLVSEMMDIPVVLDNVQRVNETITDELLGRIEWHFRAHHLTPRQVGELAASAGVGRVVITHMVPNVSSVERAGRYRSAVGKYYEGEVTIANDLDRF